MNSIDLLYKHDLRRTASRMSVLDVLRESNNALSEGEIEAQIQGLCDRATIYRTLKTFEEKGLIHKVLDETNTLRYAMCSEQECGHHHGHQHDHLHFKCVKCGTTMCLSHHFISHIPLPEGFIAESSNFLVVGTCKACNTAI